MGIELFSDSDDNEDISKIETNEDFARRYEHNKKREELQRLEELKKRGLVEDSEENSSSESDIGDDEELIGSDKSDIRFLDALVRVKKNDPIINQKDAKLFESESESENEEENNKKRRLGKEKPMYLKDVVAKQLMEEGPEFEEQELKSVVKSYVEEQDELRQDFLKAVDEAFDGDDDGDLLIEKKKINSGDVEGGEDTREVQKRLDEYFGGDENLDENEKFLKNFFLNKMWIDKDKGNKPSGEDLYGISDDEEAIEKQEKYESEYNFRFEENAGDRVLGHSRFTEGSVRKKTNARKLQRKSKEERVAQAEFERKEELKHMKNLKKNEILEKLEKIRAIAGITDGGACLLNEDDLEEDFDPEEYDRKMKEAFDVDYYDAEDANPGFCSDGDEGGDDDDLEKPDFDKEDELLGLPKDWDVCGSGSGDGFSAAREKILKRKANGKDIDLSDDNEENEEELPKEGKRKRKRKIPLLEKVALDNNFDEYYKLDYEDTIGDLKTRFKYTSVPSQRYGLSASEILMMDDKELNQYVSLKKIAPYRENEWKVHKLKRYNQKMKNKLVAQDQKTGKKHSLKGYGQSTTLVTGAVEPRKAQLEESNGEVDTVSKRSRRRHRQAELKISQLRLMKYGKIPTKSKNKKKN